MTEIERLSALNRTNLLDTVPEDRFDRLTRLAATALETEVALISLVDEDRQWFKSAYNFEELVETERCYAFCDHAIRERGVMVVPDASRDPRFTNNPYVTDGPKIAFYAGAPLVTKDGQALGTLCVIDSKPRHDFSKDDEQILQDIAASVMTEIEASAQLQIIDDLSIVNEELQHRMGNMYAHVSSLISLMAKSGENPEHFAKRLRDRIAVLAETQSVIADSGFKSAPISSIFKSTLAPFLTDANRHQVILQNTDDFEVSPRGAFTLTLMLNELATNAVKHGALKAPDGTVSFFWEVSDDIIKFRWQEHSKSAQYAPTDHKGFGSQILVRIVPLDFQGEVQHIIQPEGLLYTASAQPGRILHTP